MLPWTGLLVGRLIDDLRAEWRNESSDAVEVMLWMWTAAIVGFFTLSTFKLDHYVFPAAPALCLLCARAWIGPGPAARIGRHLIGRHPTFLDDPAEAVAFFSQPEPFYAAMRHDAYEELVARGAPLRVVYEREGMAVTSGRALWRTPEPPVRYVVAVKR